MSVTDLARVSTDDASRRPRGVPEERAGSLTDADIDALLDAALAELDAEEAAAAARAARGAFHTVQDLLSYLPRPEIRDDLAQADSGQLIDLISCLERSQSMLAALQAEAEVHFRDRQLEQQDREKVSRRDRGRGIADQIALARKISPKVASDQLALHRVLVETLPCTLGALREGEISELASRRVAQAVLVLDDEDRAAVDQEIADELPTVTATRAGRIARARADEKDAQAAVKRHARAVNDRCVSIRPAPDAMVYVSALLPVHQGVSVFAALDQAASAQRSAPGGDPRTRGQIMADTFVERATGQSVADGVPIEIELVMTDATLLGGADDTARIGDQLIPGAIARHLALMTDGDAPDEDRAPGDFRRWIRRLYADEPDGVVSRADARRRLFSGENRRLLKLRDQHCRTPYCDAPIRHIDHVVPYALGGETVLKNGVGHCARYNLAKELPGWKSEVTSGGGLTITTPTGHQYRSSPPRMRQRATGTKPPGSSPPDTGRK